MARFTKDGLRLPTNLFEAAAWHYCIEVTCSNSRCRRRAVFDPHQLWWVFARTERDDSFSAVGKRLRCTECGARGSATPTKHAEPTVRLPYPPTSAWKRAIDRFRA